LISDPPEESQELVLREIVISAVRIEVRVLVERAKGADDPSPDIEAP
jgi:hypothetical protein